MVNNDKVVEHYEINTLYESILKGLSDSGVDLNNVSADQLSAADEFHIGGTEATGFVGDKFENLKGVKVLDVGCGIGGPARFIARHMSCSVTGIDLTPSFIKTGNALTELVGLDNSVELVEGDASGLPFQEQSFDAAYMIHVGMNISDKNSTFKSVNKVLKSGALFVIYDVMKTQEKTIKFPVPWADKAEGSAVESVDSYSRGLAASGFSILSSEVKRDFAIDYFEKMMNRMEGGPSPLGLHLIMGANTGEKVQNVYQQIVGGLLAPVLMVAKKGE